MLIRIDFRLPRLEQECSLLLPLGDAVSVLPCIYLAPERDAAGRERFVERLFVAHQSIL